jgi:glycosyltransferase involved in cell wall biosynthesis
VTKSQSKSTLLLIIDPSVKGLGGHHYEYASRIAEAAHAAGVVVHLFAHQSARTDLKNLIIHKVFSRDFWENYKYYYTPAHAAPAVVSALAVQYERIKKIFSYRFRLVARRVLYSRVGYTLSRFYEEGFTSIILDRNPVSRVASLSFSRIALLIIVIGAPAYILLTRVKWGIMFGKLGHISRDIALLSFGMLRKYAPSAKSGRYFSRPESVFASEFYSELKEIRGAFDRLVVFIPNASAAEVLGYRQLSSLQRIKETEWVFLYRRPLFTGYPATYPRQSEAARPMRLELAAICGIDVKTAPRFFTDTTQLTTQYNFLGIQQFETLPVPVNASSDNHGVSECSGTITIVYLGDARDEKGFDLLPALVSKLNGSKIGLRDGGADCLRQVRFIFQTNFNVPLGEPRTRVAANILKSLSCQSVSLIDRPMSSADYDAVLKSSDLVVIPYVSEAYSARSSGVFYEAIAAGKPVVVPARTSMAHLAERHRVESLDEIMRRLVIVDERVYAYSKFNESIIRIPSLATHFEIRVAGQQASENSITFAIVQYDKNDQSLSLERKSFPFVDGYSSCVFKRRNSSCTFWIKLEPSTSDSGLHLSNFTVRFFTADQSFSEFSGVGVFDRPDDFPSVVEEMVATIDSQRAGVLELREKVRNDFDPAILVERLLGSFVD